MAQTYTNLFEQIYDFERLHAAYRRARLGKRDRMAVLRFEQNLEGELIQLQNELIWGEYRTGRYHRFCIYEPKAREVAALPFRDRVLQHSLVAAIEPIWERRFIADSYACRPGRGMHRGADRAQAMMRRVLREHGQVYALKADISKYFASIDHGVLRQLLRRHIACPRTLALCDQIIASTAAPDDLAPRGLPIGNLTSQLWANVYLHELDRFAKHELKLKHYIRYMDDFVVLHHDKAALHAIRAQIEAFLWDQLRLRTNAKTQIFPVSAKHGRGLDFLGYHMWPTHRRLRKSSIRRIVRTLKKARRLYAAGEIELDQVRASVQSWIAHASGASAYGLRAKLLSSFRFQRGLSA
ncbi:MAG: reverse transcriptase domain-containing protein [Thauera sp.]